MFVGYRQHAIEEGERDVEVVAVAKQLFRVDRSGVPAQLGCCFLPARELRREQLDCGLSKTPRQN